MKSIYLVLAFFLIILSGRSQGTTDTLEHYFFLENRLGDCQMSLNFMRFHIEPAKRYKKITNVFPNKWIYQIENKYRYEQNHNRLADLHRFYIDPYCLKTMGLDSYLSIFLSKKLIRKFYKILSNTKVNDTLTINNNIDGKNGFIITIVNKSIIEIRWSPLMNFQNEESNNTPIRIYGHDTLPASYYLHNRASDCEAAYKFMKSVIKKRPDDVKTPYPSDKYERTKVIVDIIAERDTFLTTENPSSNKYVDFYIDNDCLKQEQTEYVLALFLDENQVRKILKKVRQLNNTDYTLVLRITVSYLNQLSIQIENGRVVSLGWPIIRYSH